MYLIDEQFLHQLLNKSSRTIVGRLCKQNELIQDSTKGYNPELQKLLKEKLELLKSFNRELIYEATRDLENSLKCYSKGKEYQKFELYNPTKAEEDQSK